MKKVTIERRKNFQHIIGREYKEDWRMKLPLNSMDKRIFADTFEDMDGEDYARSEEEIEAVYSLENGFYDISDGDFTIFVEIKEGE